MRRILLVFPGLFGLFTSALFGTWSVIAVDKASGRVVIASATCVPQGAFARFPAKGLMDVQAIVVPGKGVAAAQARVDVTRENQRLIFAEIKKGTDPAEIIAALKSDPQIDGRQFGIVDLQGRSAGFSGSGNGAVSLDVQNQVEGTQIYVSVQGNILAGEEVVQAAVTAFRNASGTLMDRVMSAMEAADVQGGDRRCSCDSEPKAAVPCKSKTAHVAYILQAGPEDTSGESYNDGSYEVFIDVTNENISADEDANPVTTLRLRYEAWKRSRGNLNR